MSNTRYLKLSICISTYNRASFIGKTLDSIVDQLTDECEILVSDNASTDATEQVVYQYASRHANIRYLKHADNRGVDRNYDRAVSLAKGEFCWLMTDDDLFKRGSIDAVCKELRPDLSLIIVNTEFCDVTMSKVVLDRVNEIEQDVTYGPTEIDRLYEAHGLLLSFIGCVIIRRNVWLVREREKYFGCWYMHLAIIFQSPLPGSALFISRPLVSYRDGNTHAYSSRFFEIGAVRWPSLVWSLAPSESAKKSVCSSESWKDLRFLLIYRAWGHYSLVEYHRVVRPRLQRFRDALVPIFVALIPGTLINLFFTFYYSAYEPHRGLQLYRSRGLHLYRLELSRYNIMNCRAFRAFKLVFNRIDSGVQ